MPRLSTQTEAPTEAEAMQRRRELAIKRLKAKNGFKIHLLVYLCVNTMLVVIWAVTTSAAGLFTSPGPAWFPWPIFVILGWGVGLAAHGYSVYFAGHYTEEQIQREMRNLPFDGRTGR
jgi:fatty acid desaturase